MLLLGVNLLTVCVKQQQKEVKTQHERKMATANVVRDNQSIQSEVKKFT